MIVRKDDVNKNYHLELKPTNKPTNLKEVSCLRFHEVLAATKPCRRRQARGRPGTAKLLRFTNDN